MDEETRLAFETLNKTLSEQNRVLGVVAASTERLEKNMNGNGRPGLLDRMATLEVQRCEDIKEMGRIADQVEEMDREHKQSLDKAVSARKETTDSLSMAVGELKKKVDDLTLKALPAVNVMVYIGGAIALSIVAIIIGFASGQYSLVKNF